MSTPIATSVSGEKRYSVSVASRTNFYILAAGVIIFIILATLPLFGGTALTRRLVDFFTLLALAELWNLMVGYAGLLSAGQQGFIGIGSYTLWLFADKFGIHPFIAVIFAAIGGAIIALPAAALVFRLKGGYLAIGTWVIAETLRLIVANIKSTGGGSGITIQAASQLGTETRVPGAYWWALASALIAIVVTYLLLRSRTGLALKAMRDNDLAAESAGVNLWRSKMYTWVIAGAGCALVGAIVAIHLLRVQPAAAFHINWTAYLIFITVIGGMGTIEGPVIGTIIFYVLRETTSKYGTWYFIALGILAIVVTIWSPAGIYGYVIKKTNFMVFPLQRKLSVLDEGTAPAEIGTGAEKTAG
ncbi:MAG: branched-chain amino acid ABC transporter permease [Actinobacteria bacterium]|jgi:branched-chain amino acid transport system permease protein|nr:branched-chain amino acid ABC transporter permease [Actinomycetota bacterium]